MRSKIIVGFIIILLGTAASALAYVGPGAGLSLLSALWGLLLAIGAALAFIIFWPLRRIRQRARARRENEKPIDTHLANRR